MGSTAEALARATLLTREGRLREATELIQSTLAGTAARPARDPHQAAARAPDVIDVPFRELGTDAQRLGTHAPAASGAREASFTSHVFAHEGHRWRYRLYEPTRANPALLLPVVVMLHGCKQDAEDFARGTAMNEVAQGEGFLVLYPEQRRKSNQMGCWNWFEPQHQRRDGGEPGMIAALVRSVLSAHGGDPGRVYVAGLSAGGAMAATLADLYPELFAAVGVHSGLPARAAHDMPSAFQAMRKANLRGSSPSTAAIPTVVFHGTADTTVAAGNGDAVIDRQLAAHRAAGVPLERRDVAVDGRGRAAARVQWVDAGGQAVLEHWRVAGGPHAWSGGRAEGSFTDPRGPDASRAMAEFFLRHRNAP